MVANYTTPCPPGAPWWQCGWGANFVSTTIGSWDATPAPPGDTTPPTISQVGASPTSTGATITWTTANEGSDSQVDYGTTTAYGSTTPLNTTPAFSHNVNLTSLSPSTTYYFRVRSRDAAGNLATQPAGPLATLPDTTPPTIISPATTVSSNSVRVTWGTNEPATRQVVITGAGSSTLESNPLTFHSATVSGLLAETLYSYEVRSADPAGNLRTQVGQFRTASQWVTSMGTVTGKRSDIPNPDLGRRFEPTSARGTQSWVTGWYDAVQSTSFVSFASVSHSDGGADSPLQPADRVWSHPPKRIGPAGSIFVDLNVVWDGSRSRFAYVALSRTEGQIYYGWSLDAVGSVWTDPVLILQLNSFGVATVEWDYPSIAINSTGSVMIGAVRFVEESGQPTPAGYYTATLSNADSGLWSTGGALVSGSGVGHYTRIAATKTKFHAFVPVLNSARLPVNINWYESIGSSWAPPVALRGTGGFPPPKKNSDNFGSEAAAIAYAPEHLHAVAIAGSTDEGEWAVTFQEAYGNPARNVAAICHSTRGCGRVYPDASEQFYPGVAFSPDRAIWHTYTTTATYQPGFKPDLEIHAWLIRPGEQPYGVVAEQKLEPPGANNSTGASVWF